MDCGLIEIGNIATKASTDDIRKLKSILDERWYMKVIEKHANLETKSRAPDPATPLIILWIPLHPGVYA